MRESNPRPLPPEGRIIPLDQRPKREASNEDRTRDLVLTRHMLCQLSYRGDTVAPRPRARKRRRRDVVKALADDVKVLADVVAVLAAVVAKESKREREQKRAKEHTRRDSNPQPPDSKSGALSIAPRVPAANAVGRSYNHARVPTDYKNKNKKNKKSNRHLRDSNSRGKVPN